MKRVIVVGDGLAGCVLSMQLKKHGIDVRMIGDPAFSACSRVAAGIWNPLVFKRMTLSWMAGKLIPELVEFYSYCETITDRKFLNFRQSIRAFTEDQEKKLWLSKAMNELEEFAEARIYEEQPEGFQSCKIPNGYARILQSGNLELPGFMEAVKQYLKENYLKEKFEYSELRLVPEGVQYKNLEADGLIFCEGHLVRNNPFFKWIPLKPAKGEVLHVRIPAMEFRNSLFHKNGFLMDLEPGLCLTGSTYNWEDLNDNISSQGRQQLEEKLNTMLNCTYKVEKQLAGVRPSSSDRRPILGEHPAHTRLFVLNGLGTKGVMLAPWLSLKFVHFLQLNRALPREVDLVRFYHLYASKNT